MDAPGIPATPNGIHKAGGQLLDVLQALRLLKLCPDARITDDSQLAG